MTQQKYLRLEPVEFSAVSSHSATSWIHIFRQERCADSGHDAELSMRRKLT
jgi:hypothetical protein